jgi:hypothetical protein
MTFSARFSRRHKRMCERRLNSAWKFGPSGVPEITDEDVAKADPELAVLSAIAHGKDRDFKRSARIADAAQLASLGLDGDRSKLYVDLIRRSLSEAARQALKVMRSFKYEYQSDIGKHFFGEGREAGERSGRAALLLRLLTARFGSLPDDARERIDAASIAELENIGERLLTAQSVQEALG